MSYVVVLYKRCKQYSFAINVQRMRVLPTKIIVFSWIAYVLSITWQISSPTFFCSFLRKTYRIQVLNTGLVSLLMGFLSIFFPFIYKKSNFDELHKYSTIFNFGSLNILPIFHLKICELRNSLEFSADCACALNLCFSPLDIWKEKVFRRLL